MKHLFDDLRIILENSSQLKLLYIYFDMNMLNISFILPLNQLIRLNLEIKNQRISKDQIEQLLSSLIYLKHLELKVNVLENVVNDYFWQQLVNTFITFNFKFNVQKILKSFRTLFWLEEKTLIPNVPTPQIALKSSTADITSQKGVKRQLANLDRLIEESQLFDKINLTEEHINLISGIIDNVQLENSLLNQTSYYNVVLTL
ncbi:unnamed protein product [Adineta steineri]|uniref:Uncharacterized protein n=1 Tax=Adineta steineri TaxID=433720 RepID=A0A818VUU7_9BILA|nr:unnamed protein product [Adineta steineri]